MMDLRAILSRTVQSTLHTPSVLFLEKFLDPHCQPCRGAKSPSPGGPVSIIWASRSRRFDMALNARLWMTGENPGLAKDPDPLMSSPVALHAPVIPFAGMAPGRPPTQLMMDPRIHLGEDGLRDYMSVVAGPTNNNWPKRFDQLLLARSGPIHGS